ncbi:oxygenase MpaB family protein [Paracraurococcus ruber]|uniref:ER-bound oxygenase mpaB/mpaB'/Rubber oxygenase catalytic domain-containing protein n=1 Tax=Paracraurococcus ruber TaxID=77675 RepID=A0ABS1CSL6_9PROT|nr:oxygenase MpaB family protein [Paracraurococcus ruber]MBK1657458.1 hypothetical protein [Paracraurococcus ruber]TDG32978.1 DUF2236 domain-containing protein [Paracraurococcus ruber]
MEAALAALRDAAPDPAAGLFGPASLLWRVDREAAVFLGAGRALLLQLAHPWVAAGVAEHSTTLADPVGRFHRTFGTTYALVFGDAAQALAAARALHRRHGAVRGTLPGGAAYRANDTAALRWVWATLTDTALLAHDLLLPALPPAGRDAYYADSLRFAALFGLPPALLPADWGAFQREMVAVQATLSVTPAGRHVAHRVLSGAGRPWLRAPRWYRAVTASLLPPHLREGFGLDWDPAAERRAARVLTRLRRLYPLLPARLRQVGPAQEAMARLRGRQPDALTRALNRAWIGRPRLGA